MEVHGLTGEFLGSKPKFGDIVEDFLEFIRGAELIIHNAPFDVAFLNKELGYIGDRWGMVEEHCRIFDTLPFARELHPGQRNSLDALCRRYEVDNAHRELHGALLDAELLADVYLAMTGGQVDLQLAAESGTEAGSIQSATVPTASRARIPVIAPTAAELAAHRANLERIESASESGCVWLRMHD
jgi:DNA polymerase-3 subunit epsilon